MKAQEVLGYIIAVKGGGMAATCAALTGLNVVMNTVPILRPVLWFLAAVGLVILLSGLALAAAAEGSEEV
ncbi:MAG: hypothetical protein SFU85_07570 [Candidatus Methylacidiphilales bacterium]|nr:hypothetical protein [Candidatus Methylacidiphilales bacterium]